MVMMPVYQWHLTSEVCACDECLRSAACTYDLMTDCCRRQHVSPLLCVPMHDRLKYICFVLDHTWLISRCGRWSGQTVAWTCSNCIATKRNKQCRDDFYTYMQLPTGLVCRFANSACIPTIWMCSDFESLIVLKCILTSIIYKTLYFARKYLM